MKGTRRQKALAGVFALAVGGFLTDRLFLQQTDPQQAAAISVAGRGDKSAEDEDARGAEAAAPTRVHNALADRLEALAKAHPGELSGVRDVFCPSPAWVKATPAAGASVSSDEVQARAFAQAHRLQAVVVEPGGGMAIVNGICLSVGRGQLDGYRLVSVDETSAVLARGDVRVTLRLAADQPETEAPRQPPAAPHAREQPE